MKNVVLFHTIVKEVFSCPTTTYLECALLEQQSVHGFSAGT